MTTIKPNSVYDFSHWQYIGDWSKVTPKPPLAICKSTEGDFYQDPQFVWNMEGLMQNGIRRGTYHFHRKAYGAIKQADYFLNFVNGVLTADDLIALDIEEGGETAGQIIAWLDRVESVYRNNEIWIYSRKNLLDPIVMTSEQALRLKKYRTWIAGYPLFPDFYASMPAAYIPNQNHWGQPILWQYADNGVVAGITGNSTDLNLPSETLLNEWGSGTVTPDKREQIFNGVERVTGVRYGRKFSMIISDPGKVRFEVAHVTGGDLRDTTSTVAKRHGAQVAWNGGEWDKYATPYLPKDYSVSNGQVYIPRHSFVPSLIVSTDGLVKIDHRIQLAANIQQALSGLRYIVLEGNSPAYLDGTEPEYTDKRARSIDGLDALGRHLRLTVDGVYPDQGVTLKQASQMMLEFGAVSAFDEGGGGDTTEVINGVLTNVPEDISNGVHVERRIPQFLLLYANPIGGTMNGTAKEILGKIGTIRTTPEAVSGNDTGKRVPAGSTIEFVKVVPGKSIPTDQWFQLPDGNYLNYILTGRAYYQILTQPTTPPPPPTVTETNLKITYDNAGVVMGVMVDGQAWVKG